MVSLQTFITVTILLHTNVDTTRHQHRHHPPTFSDVYSSSGVLRLPYAEIVEPFDVYYDSVSEQSRIDYYHGLTKTVNHASGSSENDFGYTHKVFFVTTETVINQETCLIINGTKDNQISIQGIIPDIFDFVYLGEDVWEDTDCMKWQKIVTHGSKENKYTMWIAKENNYPIHYEMMGYDTLLGSHYDKYELDYYTYIPSEHLDQTLFQIGKNLNCLNVDDAGPKDVHLHSPMKEFIHNHDDHVHEAFERFKLDHGVQYTEADHQNLEHEKRKSIFRQNHRYVHSINRAGLGYKLATNRFSDWTDDELRRYRTRGVQPIVGSNGGKPFPKWKHLRNGIPESLDWRLYGAVNPVKDQAVCGSCWSFSTIGNIEGAYFLKTGKLIRLSEQALVDCSWGFDNNGCDGGNDFKAFDWIMKHGGIPTDDSYGPYLGEDGKCHSENAIKVAPIIGYVNVTPGDVEALKAAIATQGPISVSFDAELKDFTFYSNGIYYNPKCKNGTEDLDHAVLAVGYGVLDGEAYWLVKNSWSTYWGNDGYFLISQRDNNCGIATAATYAILK